MNLPLGISIARALVAGCALSLIGALGVAAQAGADAPKVLWQIGKADGGNAEFALAPKDYGSFQKDGFFVVGASDAARDWPYVHPGPNDAWAGSCAHTFTVVFGLGSVPAEGTCRLRINLLDSQAKTPSTVRIEIAGRTYEHALPKGGGDASVFGDVSKGKPHRAEVEFPASLLKTGRNDIGIVNDNGSWFLYDAVTLEVPAGAALAPVADAAALLAKARTPPARVEEIIVVFKTHFDIGYTDMASNIVQKYRTTMIDQALDVADQNRDLPPAQQFVWTIPGWPMHKILEDWPGQVPERKQRLLAALKSGRFVVHALPFTTHTELLEAEDLVRGLGYSSRIARELGLELPRDAKMTDVPEHTWMMATLLRHAGVTFMHIGCNNMSGSPQVPPLYWWEGPDGSRVLTQYSPDYGTGLFPPANWPYRTWLALQHTGDNHGPPRPDEVKKVLDAVAQRMPGVKVRIGRLSDFGDAILAEKPDLPVVRGDTPDTWIHGPMSDPAGAKIARNIRPAIAAAEALNTELRTWGEAVPNAAAAVSAAYEQSLLYGEHTWGGSIGWLDCKFGFGEDFRKERESGRFKRIEASWAEHTAYIEKARDLIAPVSQENLRALAQAVNQSGKRTVVFNPLPWARDGLVSAAGQAPFVARDVPAMGYRTYTPADLAAGSKSAVSVTATGMENNWLKATVDPARGVVTSLVDKRSGRELVGDGFGAYLYERFDSDQIKRYIKDYLKNPHWTIDFEKPGLPQADQAPYRSVHAKDFTLRFERTAVSAEAVMEAPAGNGVPHAVTTRLILYRDLPYADLEITVHDKPFEPWPEAGWLCLPFKVDDPQFRLGRLASVIDPARDVIAGANRTLFGINTGVALFDGMGSGAAFCPVDHPLVSLDTPGCWKFSKTFVPKKPAAFINLFNNQWNTNFRLWNSGTWTSRVRIWAVDRYEAERDLITPSLEARNPLMVAMAEGLAGKLPAVQSGLTVSRKGLQVTAFGANPDGACTLLRLWELAGNSGPCKVTLPAGMAATALQPVDLRGRPAGEKIKVKNGAYTVDVKAFAPMSFVIE